MLQGQHPNEDQCYPCKGTTVWLPSFPHFGHQSQRAMGTRSGPDSVLGLAGIGERAGQRAGCLQGASWSGPTEKVI